MSTDLRSQQVPADVAAGLTVFGTTFPRYAGGCNCVGKAPTAPTYRDPKNHLDDCPAKDSGYLVGQLMATTAASAFHWNHGVFFSRAHGGRAVHLRIMAGNAPPDSETLLREFYIPAAEWASIVASVSAGGESDDRWREALRFYGEGGPL